MITDSIPIDLITEILLRLPAKSIARFRSVSKQWASIIDHSHFKNLFLTKSSSHPRLIFAIEEEEQGQWSIFSLPQASSSSLLAQFHMKFPPDNMWILPRDHRQFACGYASGLIYFHAMYNKQPEKNQVSVVCNPKTGRYEALPWLLRYRKTYSFFGFDPVGKQYKVLHLTYPSCSDDHRIMTLGTRGMRWRKIRCPLRLANVGEGLCINGVLYFLCDGSECEEMSYDDFNYVIACFDVWSETFKFLYPESYCFCELINYNDKLGVVYYDDLSDDVVEFRVWVLEDVDKQEWSKYAYALRGDKLFPYYVSVVGVISTGEIVLSMADYTSGQPFYVYYFNPEEDSTVRRIEIQGFGEYHEASNNPRRVHVFVDDCSSRYLAFANNVEDVNVNDQTLLRSSIYVPYVYNEESEESESEEDSDDGRMFRGNKKRMRI